MRWVGEDIMDRQPLSAEQEAEAQRIEAALLKASREDIRAMARLLASKPDSQLFGQTEFQVRDLCHQIGAKAVETALEERKKGGTKGPA
jgi:hypothetical protein